MSNREFVPKWLEYSRAHHGEVMKRNGSFLYPPAPPPPVVALAKPGMEARRSIRRKENDVGVCMYETASFVVHSFIHSTAGNEWVFRTVAKETS